MTELVHNLLAAMKDTIDHLEWMTPATKQKALEKIATFNPKIGYPDKWKDYSLDPDQARCVLRRRRRRRATWNVDDDRKQIGKPLDRGRWGMTPPTSDAYYNPSLNEIVFPAGILQPPAFRLDAVDAINYGAIGVVIGHEISHGFDDQGAQFDAQGRLENWWTKADLDAFTQARRVRRESVRQLLHRAERPPQRQARARRVDRRLRRREPRVSRVPQGARGAPDAATSTASRRISSSSSRGASSAATRSGSSSSA